MLYLLAKAIGARKILEIGTLGGYSTIWLARAIGTQGRVVTLELEPERAAVALRNLEHAGVAGSVEIRVGKALDSLAEMATSQVGPFDLIFIDADKPNHAEYLRWALELSRPGTLIIGDNVVRSGAVADAENEDPNVRGVRRFLEAMAREPRLEATALQTVGAKGHDGFAMALVVAR
jgi:predicted O-methyltransferase YrrM